LAAGVPLKTSRSILSMTDAPHSDADQAVSHLSQSIAQAGDSHRQLAQDVSVFAKDEGLRFANLRLERNGSTLEKLQNCHGIPGLLGVQQEWLRDFLQDYASQSMRVMGALRGFTKNMMESAAENASDNIERMTTQAQDAMDRTGAAVDKAAEQIGHVAQESGGFLQETQH
jgi:ElaB/YqjD/DUF883 family membrane-anchored ribosome-binding protein